QAEDGIRDFHVTGVQTCALPIFAPQEGDETLDAKGKLVAPALIDFGVFAIDKPAFRFGGIARAALMPDQNPALDLPSRVSFIAKIGRASCRERGEHTVGAVRVHK